MTDDDLLLAKRIAEAFFSLLGIEVSPTLPMDSIEGLDSLYHAQLIAIAYEVIGLDTDVVEVPSQDELTIYELVKRLRQGGRDVVN